MRKQRHRHLWKVIALQHKLSPGAQIGNIGQFHVNTWKKRFSIIAVDWRRIHYFRRFTAFIVAKLINAPPIVSENMMYKWKLSHNKMLIIVSNASMNEFRHTHAKPIQQYGATERIFTRHAMIHVSHICGFGWQSTHKKRRMQYTISNSNPSTTACIYMTLITK